MRVRREGEIVSVEERSVGEEGEAVKGEESESFDKREWE